MLRKPYEEFAIDPREKPEEAPAWPWICELMPDATHEKRVEALENLDRYILFLMRLVERQEREEMEKLQI